MSTTIARHLRLACSGGAPMPVEVMKQFEQTFGVRVLEGYGLSETSPVACFNQFQRPSKPGTVGQPLMAVQVACVDDQDRPVKTGERGEVVIRGHNIMKGYYKRPAETAEAMRNGWFHTGDIGIFDEDGYLAIVDRKKDMILRGGFNVYPREIEEVLMTHPCRVAVRRDRRAGRTARRGSEGGRRLQAGRGGDADAIIAWSKERMAAYKYPRFVEFRDALPTSATGKILKRELRAEQALFGFELVGVLQQALHLVVNLGDAGDADLAVDAVLALVLDVDQARGGFLVVFERELQVHARARRRRDAREDPLPIQRHHCLGRTGDHVGSERQAELQQLLVDRK